MTPREISEGSSPLAPALSFLLPRTTQVFAKGVAERLIETASINPAQFRPTRFSYGIATQGPGESGEDVVARADAALGIAKRERTEATA